MTSPKQMLRHVVLRALRATAFDTRIDHHWVPDARVMLNSFQHKGYWYHGKKRERASMETISRLLRPGNTIIEVGGHIGYLGMWFRHLVGESGKLVIFEPSAANRKYLSANTAIYDNVVIESRAVADYEGEADFFVEELTGQNNSLVESYDVFVKNSANAGMAAEIKRERVKVVSLSAYCRETGLQPDFIKIDVEGAEEAVLMGAVEAMKISRPIVMVELTRRHEEVLAQLESLRYHVFDDRLAFTSARMSGCPNYFCVPEEKLSELGLEDVRAASA